MESKKLLCKIDSKVLNSKSELEAVYFTKPILVAFYEHSSGIVTPAKKIHYFKKPKPQNYPINFNQSYNKQKLQFNYEEDLECELKYVMSSKFKKSVENVEKIKIFITRAALSILMFSYYIKGGIKYTIRVSRYNGDFYMMLGNELNSSVLKAKEKFNGQFHTFYKSTFTDSLHYDPNVNEPLYSDLYGVHQSSLGEFEIIYSGWIDGIQTEDEFTDFDNLEALNTCRWVMIDLKSDSEKNYPRNYLYLWINAYLTNAKDLYIAYKNSDDIVYEPIVHKHKFDLPKEFKSHWKPSICTGFSYTFLKEVNELMSNASVNSLDTVYEFYIDSEKTITYKIFKDDPKKVVVTPEYMEYCKGTLN